MASSNNALVLPSQPPGTNSLDIRPLKGPVEIPSTWDRVWWIAAVALVAVAAWFIWRRLRLKKTTPTPAVPIPAHRRAKDQLRRATELMSDPYKFCSLVSDVLRGYVEERFQLKAPERTTEEFMDEMRSSSKLRPDHKSLLEDFLVRCDLVKFARFEPTVPELEGLLDLAYRFVDETAPFDEQPEPAPAEPQATS
jgi:hypothetical protein